MAVQKNRKPIRQVDGRAVEDVANIQNLTFNEAAGATKNLSVGPFLRPLNDGAGGFTTNATAVKSVRKGTSLAIYNNSGTLGSITFGDDNTVSVLASGATNAAGDVGHPCKQNDWSYFNSNEKGFLITSSASLLVFIIEDETFITIQQR